MIIMSSMPSVALLSMTQKNKRSGRRTHPLSTNHVGEPPKQQLAKDGSNRCSNFHAQVLIRIEDLIFAVNVSEHGGSNIDLR